MNYNPYSSAPPDLSALKALAASGALYLPLAIAFGAVVLAFLVYWKLFTKAGYSGWLTLLMFVPIVNLGTFLFLAFSDWPVHQELRRLRERLGSAGPASRYPQGGGYNPASSYVPQQYAPPSQGSYAPPAEQTRPPAPPYPPQ